MRTTLSFIYSLKQRLSWAWYCLVLKIFRKHYMKELTMMSFTGLILLTQRVEAFVVSARSKPTVEYKTRELASVISIIFYIPVERGGLLFIRVQAVSQTIRTRQLGALKKQKRERTHPATNMHRKHHVWAATRSFCRGPYGCHYTT